MKSIALTIGVCFAALTGCSKYGPDQGEVAQSPATRPAAKPATAAQVVNEALKEDVAVTYSLPAQPTYVLRCDLNSVSGVGLSPGVEGPLAQGAGAVFNGWVADEQGAPPARVVIVLKGEKSYGIQVATGADRPDVAEALKAETARKSGIAALVDTTAVAEGAYDVHFLVPETGAACDTTKRLKAGG